MQRRKDRGKDKPTDPRREYLDAEFSDEELPEGDAEAEFRKAYRPDEIENLTRSVKRMTTLSDLSEDDWTEDALRDIREFFENPNISTLCIYIDDGKLRTNFGFPTTPVSGLTYFVREPNEIFYMTNFHETVLCGTINLRVENHMLSVTRDMLTPVFYKIDHWPDTTNACVKTEFYSNLETFLGNLTDLAYKLLGLTVIYVPTVVKDLKAAEVVADKELVKRLESVLGHWATQIRIALDDQNQITPKELPCIEDEYQFWLYRYDNLRNLRDQLEEDNVDRLIQTLIDSRSIATRQFFALKVELEERIREARSNIDILSILIEPTMELYRYTDPKQLLPEIPIVIRLIRQIWLESKYFNTSERISNLFRAVSNQIIWILKNFINLREIFAGRTRFGMQLINNCVKSCKDYRILFNQMVESLTIRPGKETSRESDWQLDSDVIFQHIDVFVVRCQDVLEICRGMIDFARMDETTVIAEPKFGGSKYEEYNRICHKVEKMFVNALKRIEKQSGKIFEVTDTSWRNDMTNFRNEINVLETIIENLVVDVFIHVNNVFEGVEKLYGFHNYLNRLSLIGLLETQTEKVWKVFEDKIQQTKQEIANERNEYSVMTPYYAGRALNFWLKSRYLRAHRNILEEARWMPYCKISDDVRAQHSAIVKSINDLIADFYHKWVYDIGDNPLERLDRYLMRRSERKPGLIECNIDPAILNLCREAGYWMKFEYDLPVHAKIIYAKSDTLFYVYESVLTVTIAYNRIVEALSSTERALFRDLIKELDRKINPGLSKLTWNAEYIDAYIEDCFKKTTKEFQDTYKKANTNIRKICEEICNSPMIKIKPNYEYTLLELERELLEARDTVAEVITRNYNMVIEYILVVYEGFEDTISDNLTEWKIYLKNLDTLLEEALKQCVKHSLSNLHEALRGYELTSPAPFISIHADLIDNKLDFQPSLSEIMSLMNGTMNVLLNQIKRFRRLPEKFRTVDQIVSPYWKVCADYADIVNLQEFINTEVRLCFNELENYKKMWDPFKDIWTINKEIYFRRFLNLNPEVLSFVTEIDKYTDEIEKIMQLDAVTTVNFLAIHSDHLKNAIIERSEDWKERFVTSLLQLTEKKINDFYDYVKENTSAITKEPTDLVSMQFALHLFERLTAEIPVKEAEFPAIQEQYETLEMYEVPLNFEFRRKFKDIDRSWKAYLKLLAATKVFLTEKKEEFKNMLLNDTNFLTNDILSLIRRFWDTGPFSSEWTTEDALQWLMFFKNEIKTLRSREETLGTQLKVFGISPPDTLELTQLEKDCAAIELVWKLAEEWNEAWERYKTSNFWTIEMDEMDVTANALFRKLTLLCRELREKNWQILEATRIRVDKFKRTLPLITDLKNLAMRDRHWAQVKDIVGKDFDQTSENFTLNEIMALEMQKYAKEISEISDAATMELNIELGIEHIKETWNKVILEFTPYKDKGLYRLKSTDDILQMIEDNMIQLSSMKITRFVEPFIDEVDYWERTLSHVGEVIEATLMVQRDYTYMDSIFNTEDVRKQLPSETSTFDKISSTLANITSGMYKRRFVLAATKDPPGLLNVLNELHDKLEVIQRSLEQYLETKRHVFPRFYFISNDDLLEILANSKKPDLIQPHVKKLFGYIKFLKFGRSIGGKSLVEAMISDEDEIVEFQKFVILEGQVEQWLNAIEEMMRVTLRGKLRECQSLLRKTPSKRDRWVKEWPGQPGITAIQIQWTTDSSRALRHCKLAKSKKPLRKAKKRQNEALAAYSAAIRGNLSPLQRLKFKAVIVIEIHARDVIERLYKLGNLDENSFEWLSQLRFYWDNEIDDCVIRQTNTRFVYGYEYLGCSDRLVITPLTDRCYITLTTALHLYRGGSPKGPAGTGKTETVKDLGKALGFNVIVQNCSEGLDYKSMGRLFSGLAQSGAWGCFDEFNRINVEVLSVVAQQILSILTALARQLDRFVFEGNEISLVSTCGIFITMNPGYAGRTELPDNLKSMFRPISMMVPDSGMIAEISLFGEGFDNTRVLARKIFALYSLARQQLSKQYHYDFGLRGIVTLTRYAGKKKRLYPNLPDEEVILLAMRDMNNTKLTSDDLPLFIGIMSDLFPGVDAPTIDYTEFISYVTRAAEKMKIQPVKLISTKVLELHETKISRHSTMIVGESNTAKSVVWKILASTLTAMRHDDKPGFNVVHVYPINPKALSLGELYGEYNLSTGEWLDGVIPSIMRKTCSDTSPDQKWILFDGPVDAVWIENMNSVMDDNKLLTLINNERIKMPEQVSLLFEVLDLATASPATVSRAGIVYNDYKDLGWRPYVTSWLHRFTDTPEFLEEMDELFERYVDVTLEFVRNKCVQPVPVSELHAVQSLCKLLETLATAENGVKLTEDRDAYSTICRLWFIFCMIWSLCSSVNEEGRQKVDNFIREMEGSFPLRDTVYEYYVDMRQRSYVSWEERLSQAWKFQPGTPFHEIIVPTVDTARYNCIVSALLQRGHPVLLVGPSGAGKSLSARSVLDELDHARYTILTINMSAITTSQNVQSSVESRLEKRTKGVYIPVAGKTMITFMDDFNMPMKGTYGAQPPLELIRQWIEYGFWYDRQKQQRVYVQGMQLLTAMGLPGGGRNDITNRLLTKFNLINMTYPVEKQILKIYGTMLNQHLAEFHPEVKSIATQVTACTVELYNQVILNLLPTPAKTHYLFNLRDISRIYQGLLRSHKDYQYSINTFLRLWIHETFQIFCGRLIDNKDREWFVSHLNDQLGKHFELTFHNVCPEKRCPLYGNFMNAWSIYEDLKDIGAVRRHLEKRLAEYNQSSGAVHLDLIFFQDAIEHLCRIARVISEPRGNLLLVGIGGNGRRSLSRFASYMCYLNIFQITITSHYRMAEFCEDLKTLYAATGIKNEPTSFLFSDGQVVEEQLLEIINNMLSTGEVANLYKPDEMEDIKNRLSKEAKKAGKEPTTEAIYEFMIERVRSNMHLILSMNPIGDAFRTRLRQYPALINCTTIDWFLEWPREALLEVGNKFLMNLNLTLTITGENKEDRPATSDVPLLPLQERMRNGISSVFALVHGTVSRYSRRMAAEMKRYSYVTPTNFLELVTCYEQMLATKRRDLTSQADKLRNGFFKIDDTREKVNEMAEELEITQRQVDQSTRECDEFLMSIVSQRRDVDETQKMVITRSAKIAEEQEECKELEIIARKDLETVEPALEEAIKALDALNKKDLAEIKSFARPPPKVEMVMEAVMILKGASPSWAESKRQLGDVNFINTLRDYDKDRISDRVLRMIGKYTSDPEFDPIKVGVVSTAAKSLCMWVIAMENYGKLFRVVKPKREKLEIALASLKQKEAALEEATRQLQKLNEELQRLQGLYDTKMKEKDELIRLADMLKLKLGRAAMLLEGLADERVRWQQMVESLAEFFEWLLGNCLISTAFVSYLGPFLPNYRQELIDMWLEEVKAVEIPTEPDLNIKSFLADATTIREWIIQGLPSDGFSTENGIIVTWGKRWPLIIDPQRQAVKWIRNMEAKNSLKMIDFGQPDFVKTLEKAIQMGHPVLLENVGEKLDPALNPILQKSFVRVGDQTMINFNDKLITYNDKFRLFITTKLPNPHYAPEISTKTTLCNFAIKEQGLDAQLLGIVVRKEKPQLEQQKDNLVVFIASNERKLKELEDRVLYLLSATSGSLLDDVDLIDTLQTSKATSISIHESLAVSEETEKEIDRARSEYQPCATRASILFFVLNDMSHIDPMYQFSLDAYIALFETSIERSEKNIKLSERIENLNDYHTYAVYKNTCRGLFERHKLLFSFHMCTQILKAQGKINASEYAFLLRAGIVLDRENQPDKPAGWIPDDVWDNITNLDELAGFHGLVSSFEETPRDWYNWYINTEVEKIALPGDWEQSCNAFQRMLFVRCCRPDRIFFCVSKFVVRNLGQRFVEPPVLDIKAVLDDSTAETPLIFILSAGVDPSSSLGQLAAREDMSDRFMTLSLGQGQAPIATNMIEMGSREGYWVFLANCHLSLSWMPALDKIIDLLVNGKTLNPRFRLWLSSSPTPEFPISILQAGIKMTTEPPMGLKANMKRLYGLITPTRFEFCNAESKYKKLLFALVFFHSVLLERKKFQQLGWNIVYSFNDSDFEVSENLLQVYLDEYSETPWETLKYLIAGVCYGGHVTDDWDRRLLMTYIQQYFTDEVLVIPHYRLSSLPTYYVPRDGSLESYRDFIVMLPSADKPEAFGQHPNADIACLITEARSMFQTLMSMQVRAVSSVQETNKEGKVMQLSADLASKVPSVIDYEIADKLVGPSKTPLSVVLLQEIKRYNVLLIRIHSSLEELERAIKGLTLMTTELEEIFTSIYEGRVPTIWLTAYPSLKLLGTWTRDLINRVEHFADWAKNARPPNLFWLASFTYPTAFLTAVMQEYAREWNVSVDSLSWEFVVLANEESSIREPPADGVYVRSIFMEGAGWDKKNGTLVDPEPMQLVCDMPVIHFLPTETPKKRLKDVYRCPCYYYPNRAGEQNRASFVVAVDLKTGPEGSDHWIKRGTALLLSLAT